MSKNTEDKGNNPTWAVSIGFYPGVAIRNEKL